MLSDVSGRNANPAGAAGAQIQSQRGGFSQKNFAGADNRVHGFERLGVHGEKFRGMQKRFETERKAVRFLDTAVALAAGAWDGCHAGCLRVFRRKFLARNISRFANFDAGIFGDTAQYFFAESQRRNRGSHNAAAESFRLFARRNRANHGRRRGSCQRLVSFRITCIIFYYFFFTFFFAIKIKINDELYNRKNNT